MSAWVRHYGSGKVKAIVTGATGFLGGHVVSHLLNQGWQVIALGRNTTAGAKLSQQGAIFKVADIVDLQALQAVFESADVIFIGGTGGDTAEIVKLSENKLKSGGRIVIGIILIETLYSVLQILDKLKFDSIDITQVTISKSRKTTTGTMMLARNPVTIISATKI